jgi:L-threonylcarbamoyladenylate synthase
MDRLVVDPTHPEPNLIAHAADVLRRGGLVAFPTETVYGLGANALDRAAVARIYAAKGRPGYNPLIVHVAEHSQAMRVVREWNDVAERLARAFWPGPITLVLPKRLEVPDEVTAGLPTVGVRVPNHPIALALLRAADVPVAAPSANKSMLLSPTTADHVAKSLGDAVDVILDGGATAVGIESTVIDVSGSGSGSGSAERAMPTLLRPGTISVPQIEAVVGPIAIASLTSGGGAARRSPGMLDKHYSPRAELVLVDRADLRDRLESARAAGKAVGALVVHASVTASPLVIRMPSDAASYAARLYQSLHALDDVGCDVIVVERVDEGAEWLGVRDRLARAAR